MSLAGRGKVSLITTAKHVTREGMPHSTRDRGTLVIIPLPLAEANLLLDEPLAAAVGFANSFVICPCCADRLSRDLDEAGRAVHPLMSERQ